MISTIGFTTKAGLDARLALEPANQTEAQMLSRSLKRDIRNLTHAMTPKVFATLNEKTREWLTEEAPLERTAEKVSQLLKKFDLSRTIRRMFASILGLLGLGLAAKVASTPEAVQFMRDTYCTLEDEVLAGAARAQAYAAETTQKVVEFVNEHACAFSSEAISAFEQAKGYAGQMANDAAEQAAFYAKATQDFVEENYCNLSSEMLESFERANGYISQKADEIYQATAAAWELTGGAFAKASNAIGEGLSTAWSQGAEAVSTLAKSVEEVFSNLYQATRGFAGGAGETTSNALAVLGETGSILSLSNIAIGVGIGLGVAAVGYVANRYMRRP